MEPRLKSEIMVSAAIRAANRRGVALTVVRHGDPDAGLIYIVVSKGWRQGCTVLVPERNYDTGKIAWRPALDGAVVEEPDAEAYLERQRRIDPDLWVVELDDRDGWNPFEEMF